MKKYFKKIIFCAIFFSGFLVCQNAQAECSGVSPTWIATPDYASVSSCVSRASAGDTINVSAGSETWTGNLLITKSINIIGAGIGKTIITGSFIATNNWALSPDYYHIAIVPATPADNPIIRISGFTLTFGYGAAGIFYYNTSTNSDLTNVRFDHLNIYSPAGKTLFFRYGLAHGVMDNCQINGRLDMGGAATLWTTNGYEYGTNSNFYFEDNTFTTETTTAIEMCSGNGAGRYAFRYNTINIPINKQVFPIFDLHGNQYNVRASGFGAEIYGNTISTDGNAWTTVLYNQRGGKSLVFNNPVTWASGGGIQTLIKEEHLDSDGAGVATNAINGQPQHVSDSYYWNNTGNGTEIVPALVDELAIEIPTENTHVWFKKASFNGSVGMGCGKLASRPATCAIGVAYWATNQSCTDMTGLVGVNPSTPIAGTLYKCTATNTWTEYYTPYTYPHPLRTEANDVIAPASPTGLLVS